MTDADKKGIVQLAKFCVTMGYIVGMVHGPTRIVKVN